MGDQKLSLVKINSIDVTKACTNWMIEDTAGEEVGYAQLTLRKQDIDELLTLSTNQLVEIWRGWTSATDTKRFCGYIAKIESYLGYYVVTAYNKLWQAIRANVNRIFIAENDAEAGKISEIFKTLVTTYAGLNADNTSIQDSGGVFILDRFICKDTDVFERILALADALGWTFYYRADTDKVYFEPKGFTTNSNAIMNGGAGSNVAQPIVWHEDISELFNVLRLKGSRVLVETTELKSGNGSTKTFTLTYVPESIKVYVGGVLQKGGIAGSTSGADYTVDKPNASITFAVAPPSGTNNIEIRYSYTTPLAIVRRNDESISKYTNNIPVEKTITINDITTRDDMIVRANNLINIYSKPFHTAKIYLRTQAEKDFNLFVGQKILVRDFIHSNYDNTYVIINRMREFWPDKPLELDVGDKEYRLAYDVKDILFRLKRLEEQYIETTDIVTVVQDITKDELANARYLLVKTRDVSSATDAIWDHPNATWDGTGVYDEYFNLGDFTTARIIWPGKLITEEFCDTVFKDTANTTATWDTTNKQLIFSGSQQAQSLRVYDDATNITSAILTATISSGADKLTFYLSADDGMNWEEVTNGTTHIFTNTGQKLKWKVISYGDAVITKIEVQII